VIFVILPISRLSKTVKVYSDSIVERFSTLFTVKETWTSGSLEWRKIENQYAWRNIVQHPLLGIGLFNIYRPPLPGMNIGREGWDSKRFIHNGYLWVLVNMGLIGFIPLMWFYIRFLIRGLLNWRKIRDPKERSVVLGYAICGVALSLSILVEPRLMQWRGIMVIATIAGMNEVIIHRNKKDCHEMASSG
jgi:O-antigen ligase